MILLGYQIDKKVIEHKCRSPQLGPPRRSATPELCFDFPSWMAEFSFEYFSQKGLKRTKSLEFFACSKNVWAGCKYLWVRLLLAGFWGLAGSTILQL